MTDPRRLPDWLRPPGWSEAFDDWGGPDRDEAIRLEAVDPEEDSDE